MTDLQIRETKESIIQYLNSQNLPVEVKRLVVGEIYNVLCVKADLEVKEQALARQLEQKKEE